jgi:plasmid stability protein
MLAMPTLYIRNVPPEVYEALKARAKRQGRSVNAEALQILEEATGRDRSPESVADRLWELAKDFKLSPDDPSPEEMIRQMREERGEELYRRIRGD